MTQRDELSEINLNNNNYDDCNGTYVIVEFPEETKDGRTPMSIISSNWVIEEDGNLFAYWPNHFKNDKEMSVAVKQHTTPIEAKCVKCPIVVKFSSVDYDRVKSKLKKLEECTSLSESGDDQQCSRRRIFKRKYSDFEVEANYLDDDDDFDPPPPPKLVKDNLLSIKTQSTSSSRSSSPFNIGLGTPSSVNRNSRILSNKTPSQTITSTDKCKCSEVVKQLVTKTEILQKDIAYLIKLVQNSVNNDVINVSDSTVWDSCKNEADLRKINLELCEDREFVKYCGALQTLGGKDTFDTTKKVLTKLLSHDLCLKLNWTGRHSKLPFKQFENINRLILAVVRKNPLSRNATQTEVETITKSWLRNAYDREGGRQNRKKKIREIT